MQERKLLVLDTSYAYEAIAARKLYDSVTCRDLGGFFEHVWTVHPFASLVSEGETEKLGKPEIHELNPAHTFIDGKIGRFEILDGLPSLNFLAGQVDLVGSLISLIRREKIGVIRVGDPLFCGLLGVLLSRACRIPFVVRINANYDKAYEMTGQPMMPRFFRNHQVEKSVVRFVLSRADLVAAVNQDNLNFGLANGAREQFSTIFRYGNLVDKRHLTSPESRRGGVSKRIDELWPGEPPFLLHIGRLEEIKCPEDPVKALAMLHERGHEDVKLLMVGDGSMRERLVELSRTLGVHEHVAFVGNRDQEWLAEVIPRAAAVISPITGRALTEAAFGAAPVVAYDLDWQGELVRTDETGILVPPRAVDAMADGLSRFLREPAYARAMGDALRVSAFEMLDPERLDQHERDQYEALFRRRANS